jgi:hypothetical protein
MLNHISIVTCGHSNSRTQGINILFFTFKNKPKIMVIGINFLALILVQKDRHIGIVNHKIKVSIVIEVSKSGTI